MINKIGTETDKVEDIRTEYQNYYERCLALDVTPEFSDFQCKKYHDSFIITEWTGKDDVAVIPEFVSCIMSTAFNAARHIRVVDFRHAELLTDVPIELFFNHDRLEEVYLSDYITKIGNMAFANTGIKTLIIPDRLKVIGEKSFYECKNLTEIQFERTNKLELIGVKAFMGSGVKELLLPPSLERMHSRAFCACQSLERVVTGSNFKHLSSNVFECCKALKELDVSNSTKLSSLSEYLCFGCESLLKLYTRDNIRIEKLAFAWCNKELVIESVKTREKADVHYDAFWKTKEG